MESLFESIQRSRNVNDYRRENGGPPLWAVIEANVEVLQQMTQQLSEFPFEKQIQNTLQITSADMLQIRINFDAHSHTF